MKAALVATGSYLPGKPVPNAELGRFPPARIPLIEQKTGIAARHYAAPEEATSDLGVKAAQACLEAAGLPASALDAIILSTSTPDHLIPSSAPAIQHALGASQAFAFDVNSVCAGAVNAIALADSLVRAQRAQRVLVVAADTYSRFLNPDDFSTAPYFGDGAGAALFESVPDEDPRGLLSVFLRSDGSGSHLIRIPSGGSRLSGRTAQAADSYFKMDGKAVFEFATTRGVEAVSIALERAKLTAADLDWLIPHQANRHICEHIAQKIGLPLDRLVTILRETGNTASASPLIALDWARRQASAATRTSCLVAFGGGLSYGAVILKG